MFVTRNNNIQQLNVMSHDNDEHNYTEFLWRKLHIIPDHTSFEIPEIIYIEQNKNTIINENKYLYMEFLKHEGFSPKYINQRINTVSLTNDYINDKNSNVIYNQASERYISRKLENIFSITKDL